MSDAPENGPVVKLSRRERIKLDADVIGKALSVNSANLLARVAPTEPPPIPVVDKRRVIVIENTMRPPRRTPQGYHWKNQRV
ncbi:MAG: hypothetical protein AAB573_01495 [Patescibacteria group bacterium]